MIDDEAVWKKRFLLLTLVRLGGTLLTLLGLAVAFGDIVRPGGFRALGAAIIVIGLVDLVIAPRILRRRWLQS